MVIFFKNIFKGLLYVLFLPFGLAAIVLYAIFGIGVFFFQFGKLIYLFFTGRSFKNELREDLELKRIAEANAPKEEDKKEEPSLSLYPSDSEMYKTDYVSPTFEKKEESNNDSSLEENDNE